METYVNIDLGDFRFLIPVSIFWIYQNLDSRFQITMYQSATSSRAECAPSSGGAALFLIARNLGCAQSWFAQYMIDKNIFLQ